MLQKLLTYLNCSSLCMRDFRLLQVLTFHLQANFKALSPTLATFIALNVVTHPQLMELKCGNVAINHDFCKTMTFFCNLILIKAVRFFRLIVSLLDISEKCTFIMSGTKIIILKKCVMSAGGITWQLLLGVSSFYVGLKLLYCASSSKNNRSFSLLNHDW